MPSRREHLASLPRKRVTAGALVRDRAGRVLLVEPTYRDDWLPPGGTVEPHESPAQGAAREVFEELGLPLPIGRPLAVQWDRDGDDPDGVLNFAYDGGVAAASTIERFRLPPVELASFRFVDADALGTLAAPVTAALLTAALDALTRGVFVELGR